MRDLKAETIEEFLLPAVDAVAHFPRIELTEQDIEELGYGRVIAGSLPPDTQLAAATDSQGNLIALLAEAPQGGLKPHRFFG